MPLHLNKINKYNYRHFLLFSSLFFQNENANYMFSYFTKNVPVIPFVLIIRILLHPFLLNSRSLERRKLPEKIYLEKKKIEKRMITENKLTFNSQYISLFQLLPVWLLRIYRFNQNIHCCQSSVCEMHMWVANFMMQKQFFSLLRHISMKSIDLFTLCNNFFERWTNINAAIAFFSIRLCSHFISDINYKKSKGVPSNVQFTSFFFFFIFVFL